MAKIKSNLHTICGDLQDANDFPLSWGDWCSFSLHERDRTHSTWAVTCDSKLQTLPDVITIKWRFLPFLRDGCACSPWCHSLTGSNCLCLEQKQVLVERTRKNKNIRSIMSWFLKHGLDIFSAGFGLFLSNKTWLDSFLNTVVDIPAQSSLWNFSTPNAVKKKKASQSMLAKPHTAIQYSLNHNHQPFS